MSPAHSKREPRSSHVSSTCPHTPVFTVRPTIEGLAWRIRQWSAMMALANSTSAVLSITPQSLVPPWATGSGCRSSGSGCHYTQNRVIYPSDVIDMDHARRLVQFEYEEAEAEDATSLLSAAAATATQRLGEAPRCFGQNYMSCYQQQHRVSATWQRRTGFQLEPLLLLPTAAAC